MSPLRTHQIDLEDGVVLEVAHVLQHSGHIESQLVELLHRQLERTDRTITKGKLEKEGGLEDTVEGRRGDGDVHPPAQVGEGGEPHVALASADCRS